MAIPGYTPGINFPAGVCVGTGKFVQMLRNLKALAKFAEDTGAEFKPTPVEETITGPLDEDVCVVLRERSIGDSTIEKKTLLVSALFNNDIRFLGGSGESFSISNTGADPDGTEPSVAISVNGTGATAQPTAINTVSVLCDDVPVWEGPASEVIAAEFDCPRDSEIKLCARATVQGGTPGPAPVGSATVRFCGCLLCVTPFSSDSIEELWCPPCSISIVCKPGSEILHLLYQNILGLCRYFQRGGQKQDYFAHNFQDELDHPLVTNIQNPATWVVFGQVTICASAIALPFASRAFTVRPFVGCESERVNCNVKVHRFIRDENDAAGSTQEACLTVKFFACGRCQPGETLSAGFNFEDICEGNNPFGDNLTITHAEQEYCTYTFEEIPIGALGAFRRPDATCITDETLNSLSGKTDFLESVVCNRQPVLCDFERDFKTLDDNEEAVLFAAVPLPNPPPNPLPNPWPPVRILNYMFTFQFCLLSNNPIFPTEDTLTVFATLEILCGGEVIKTVSPPNNSTYQFIVADSGRYFQCSPEYCQLCCDIQCPIDQPLTIRPNIFAPGFATGQWAVNLTCQRLGF